MEGVWVRAADREEAAQALALLYGTSTQDFLPVIETLTNQWVAESQGRISGVVGLRPATQYGAELLGGPLPGPDHERVALALLAVTLETQPHTFAYAEAERFSEVVLRSAGLFPVSAYREMTGPLPPGLPVIPAGYRLVPLAQVQDMDVRLAAQRAYLDQPGHTPATAADVVPNAHGSDDRLGWLAFSSAAEAVGTIRGWLEGETLSVGNPGVHAAHRHTELRQALLLASCQAAGALGATALRLQSWGETERSWQADEALGLHSEVITPIYGPPLSASML